MSTTLALDLLRDGYCDIETIIEETSQIEGVTPEDILVEQEKRRELLTTLTEILSALTKKQQKILWFLIRGWTQESVAKVMGITQPCIVQYVNTIQKRIMRKVDKQKLDSLFELLQAPQSKKEATMPQGCGLPYEWLKEQSNGIKKTKIRGVMQWRSCTICKLPEYFNETFGDSNTQCNLCATCSRKKDMPNRNG